MEIRNPSLPERSKEEAFAMIAEAGFDGACMDPSADEIPQCREYAHLFADHGLGAMVNAFPYVADDMVPILDFAKEMQACMVNVISGVMPIKPEDAVTDVRRWIAEASERDMPILFETHRDGLLNDLYFTLQLMDLIPEMRLCADLSHSVIGSVKLRASRFPSAIRPTSVPCSIDQTVFRGVSRTVNRCRSRSTSRNIRTGLRSSRAGGKKVCEDGAGEMTMTPFWCFFVSLAHRLMRSQMVSRTSYQIAGRKRFRFVTG